MSEIMPNCSYPWHFFKSSFEIVGRIVILKLKKKDRLISHGNIISDYEEYLSIYKAWFFFVPLANMRGVFSLLVELNSSLDYLRIPLELIFLLNLFCMITTITIPKI